MPGSSETSPSDDAPALVVGEQIERMLLSIERIAVSLVALTAQLNQLDERVRAPSSAPVLELDVCVCVWLRVAAGSHSLDRADAGRLVRAGRLLPLKVATASKSAAKAPVRKVRKTAHIDHA